MKKHLGLFIILIIAVGAADILQGLILTLLFTPDIYLKAGNIEMLNFIKYSITALTIGISLLVVNKFSKAKET